MNFRNFDFKSKFEYSKIKIKHQWKIFETKLKLFIEKQKRIATDPKTFYLVLKNVTKHFCYNTALHGYRYIALIHLSVIERFLWTFIVLFSLLTALCLISLSLDYENTKGTTLTMIDSTYYPIYDYPFPGITICSFNRLSRKKALNLAEQITCDAKEVPGIYRDIGYLTNLFYAEYNPNEDIIYKRLEENLGSINLTADEALEMLSPTCPEILQVCKWKGRITRCDSLFQATRTPEGICCSFNHFDLKNRRFEGYNAERYKYSPKKVVGCGENMGLTLVLQSPIEDYFISEFFAAGIKVSIHHPYNYPEWNTRSIMITPFTYTSISVVPYRTYTTKEVAHLNIKNRGCIYSHEQQLLLYTNYTHENCLNECRYNLIIKLCNCIPFYYVNDYLENERKYRICNLTDISCLSKHKRIYMSSIPGMSEDDVKDLENHEWGEETGSCYCPQSCESLQYAISETQINLDSNKIKPVSALGNVTIVNIFYRNLFGTINKTDVYKRWHALLGLIGGIMGLCIGFSMTGALDIPYYYILRLLFDISTAIKIGPEKKTKDLYKNATTKIQLFQTRKKNYNTKNKSSTKDKQQLQFENVSSVSKSVKLSGLYVNIRDFKLFKNKNETYFPYLE